jgi:hypothetical protein
MATLALLRNVNLKVVSERLGHASIRTTADVYAHVTPSLQAAATEELGSILYGEPQISAREKTVEPAAILEAVQSAATSQQARADSSELIN